MCSSSNRNKRAYVVCTILHKASFLDKVDRSGLNTSDILLAVLCDKACRSFSFVGHELLCEAGLKNQSSSVACLWQ